MTPPALAANQAHQTSGATPKGDRTATATREWVASLARPRSH
jgi:hypothetical protein